MLNVTKKFAIVFSLLIAFNTSATLITTDLSDDHYVSYQGLDWAWASPVNQETWWGSNVLKLPEFHDGWRFATAAELNVLVNELGLAAFTRINGSYIQAVSYWNTNFTHVDANNLSDGMVSSQWDGGWYETFYVRNAGAAIPEPSTLLLFALGLMGLLVRNKI